MNSIFADALKRYQKERLKAKRTIHSELHALVEDIRMDFGETASRGKGSFGYYLGFLKRLPIDKVKRFKSESRQAKETNGGSERKLFWWKVGQELRQRRSKTPLTK